MTDMIVARMEVRDLPDKGRVNLLHFHQGQVLLISAQAVGVYRNEDALVDPLGNGVIGYHAIPDTLRPEPDAEGSVVQEQRAGCVRLHSGAVLFIRPDGVALYDNGDSALRNVSPHWLIALA